MMAPRSFAEARRAARLRLADAGLANPEREAGELVARAAGVSPRTIDLCPADPWSAPAHASLEALVARRLDRVPLAYLLHEWDFLDFTLTLTPDVLIPRSETEELFVWATRLAREFSGGNPARGGAGPTVVDVGAGAGGLALAFRRHWPAARVIAVDCSAPALAVARWNARRHGVERGIRFLQSDLLTWAGAGSLDIVAANLPYVATGDWAGLAPEVRREPRLALDGGPDGLDVIRRLVPQAARALSSGGRLFLEIGRGQAGETARLLEMSGFRDVRVEKDMGKIERFVGGARP
jgi:release factor glutamine methyltransferase